MNYELLIDTSLEYEDLSSLLYKFMHEVIKEEVKYGKSRNQFLNYDIIYISSKYFTLSIDLDKEDEDDFIEIGHDYGINKVKHIKIELFAKIFEISWKKILEFIGILLNNIDGDMLLIDDTSFPIMRRKNGKLVINNKLDEYKIRYITKENLKLLNYFYLKEEII